jgi:hypothetical protein
MTNEMQAGQRLARGVARHLASLGMVSIEEFVPARGLRVDVIALGPKGEIWVVECKSNKADFQSDNKWQGYFEWCDKFFWAVDSEFPIELLPDKTGLILADAYDADIVRMAPLERLVAPRRKVMVQKFATQAARRLQTLRDPDAGSSF